MDKRSVREIDLINKSFGKDGSAMIPSTSGAGLWSPAPQLQKSDTDENVNVLSIVKKPLFLLKK